MPKTRFIQFVLRVVIGLLYGLTAIGRGALFLLKGFGRGIGGAGRRGGLPVLILFLKLGFAARRLLRAALHPIRGAALYIIVHRYTIHLAAAMLIIFASLVSFDARTARAEDLGTGSLLYEIVSGGAGELIEEEVEESVSYESEYLPRKAAVVFLGDSDFDYIDAPHVRSVAGGSAVIAPGDSVSRPSLAPRTQIETYVVQEGDTAGAISERFNIKLVTLLWANKLTARSYIRPGDKLTIPPVDGVLHAIKRGDTVAKLAQRYSAKQEDIISWNKLGAGAELAIGETMVIPGGRQPVIVAPARVVPGIRPPGIQAAPGGPMLWPLASRRITQYFGWRHTGLDVGAPTGTAIYAAEDGVVEFSGWLGGYGNNVLINHGKGIKTRYAHNSRNFVSVGTPVAKGDSIAAIGSTGRSTGPHVHFEVIVNGRFRNPLEFIR